MGGAPMGGAPMGGAPKAGMSGAMKIGCGLGGGMAVLAIVGAIVVLLVSGGSSGDRRSKTSKPGGQLRNNIPSTVGKYSSKQVQPLQVNDAVDAVLVIYRNGSKTMTHAVAVFPSNKVAESHLEGGKGHIAKEASSAPTSTRVRDVDKKVIGRGYFFSGSLEYFVYQIGKTMGIVEGARNDVKPFFAALP